jgi:DNA-directed RNA polymerase III subunit RPC4
MSGSGGSGGNPSDLVKKLALKAAISPLNASKSGR